MLVAHHLAAQVLPAYSSKFSRHDYTLPQLFACLCAKEMLKSSYRQIEAVLRDSPHWCHAIGMGKVPDHNTLCNAARTLLRQCSVKKLLDAMARWAAKNRALGLNDKPIAGDSSCYELHHVSRHYQRRRDREERGPLSQKARRRRRDGRKRNPRGALRRLPKLAIAVSCHSHLILGMWRGTGTGSDAPHFEPLLSDARRRIARRSFMAVFDAGYDSERNHQIARQDLGVRSIMPALIGRPTDKKPTYWRAHMKRLLHSKQSRKRCGYTQRWQSETVTSMMKRNLGSALRGKTAHSRKRDLALKVLTHNLMIIR